MGRAEEKPKEEKVEENNKKKWNSERRRNVLTIFRVNEKIGRKGDGMVEGRREGCGNGKRY